MLSLTGAARVSSAVGLLTPMTENEFWCQIAKVDVAALNSGGEDEAVRPLIESLATLQASEIEEFDDWLAKQLFRLDTQAHAESAGKSGRSGDGFLYARCFVVASGRAFYSGVLADPAKFPASIEKWCEPLLYVPQRAWSEVTGKDEEDWDYVASVSYETGSNKDGWK
jgi:hypothetical protein